MKGHTGVISAFAVLFLSVGFSYAGEHGGKEHGGKEHGAAGTIEPSADDIRGAIKKYADDQSLKTGAFEVSDPQTGKLRRLKLLKVHERVGKTGGYFYSCADFKDMDSGQTLDLDLDVQSAGGKLDVKDVRIHKVDGKERYTYDADDNRAPVTR